MKKLELIEAKIRDGAIADAGKALKDLTKRRPKREMCAKLCELARRAGLPWLGVRILNPIVRHTGRVPVRASEAEKAEYADCLTAIGAVDEAIDLLETISSSEAPQSLLFLAFARVAKWDYAGSITCLQSYLNQATISAYQRLVGGCNLAAALIWETRYAEAEEHLATLEVGCREAGAVFLNRSVVELKVRSLLGKREFAAAEALIKSEENTLLGSTSTQSLILRKWRAFLAAEQCPESGSVWREIQKIRVQANQLQHWETVRDCDRFVAQMRKDTTLLAHLFFGTDSESFRSKIQPLFGASENIPSEYEWVLGERLGRSVKFDLLRGELNGKSILAPGSVIQRALVALAADFYRPIRLATFHSKLYPEEFFNPHSSPNRVHRVLKRLRDFFATYRIPILVREYRGSYLLSSESRVGLVVGRNEWIAKKTLTYVELLRAHLAGGNFTTQEVADILQVSYATANRVLLDAQKEGRILRTGKGKSTSYRIAA